MLRLVPNSICREQEAETSVARAGAGSRVLYVSLSVIKRIKVRLRPGRRDRSQCQQGQLTTIVTLERLARLWILTPAVVNSRARTLRQEEFLDKAGKERHGTGLRPFPGSREKGQRLWGTLSTPQCEGLVARGRFLENKHPGRAQRSASET